MTSATQRGEEDALNVRNLNEKENRPPANTRQTNSSINSNKSMDKKGTSISLAIITETTESVENPESGTLLVSKIDDRSSMESVAETTTTTISAEGSSIAALQEKEQDQQQKKQPISLAVTQQKRKWARQTKVVKLEEQAATLLTLKGTRTDEEDEEDDEAEEAEEEEESTSSDSGDSDGEYGKTSKRTKVEKSAPVFKTPPESELSEYGMLYSPFQVKTCYHEELLRVLALNEFL